MSASSFCCLYNSKTLLLIKNILKMSTPTSNGIDATAYDKRVALVEKLFNKEDFNSAASEATKVLDDLPKQLSFRPCRR